MIRVLIADDSAFMRKVLSDLFHGQPDFEVVGTAMNGKDAISKVKQFEPDLLTMDINMPVMDGLDALAVIMEECPMPVVMLSSLTQQGTDATIRALSLGAVDFISKAGGSISRIDTIESEILRKCRNAAGAKVYRNIRTDMSPPTADSNASQSEPPVMKRVALPRRQGLKLRGDMPTAPLPAPDSLRGVGGRRNNPLLRNRAMPETIQARSVGPIGAGAHRLVVIGTSTGGPQALQNVITQLPGRLSCGVVVVQHMPPGFTKALADRLDSISQVAVKEAEDGDVIRAGYVYIAPGDFHLRIKEDGGVRRIALGKEPPVGNHRPAVDVMFDSAAAVGRNLVAVIMTGMGSDGCAGMEKIKDAGGYSIAQDESTCVVYGMPKAVVDAGLADEVRPVQMIARAIVEAVNR